MILLIAASRGESMFSAVKKFSDSVIFQQNRAAL